MTKQTKRGLPTELRRMSSIEKLGAFGAVVALLADGVALFTFATGITSVQRYIPPAVPTQSALLLFALVSGLILIYGWFALSWYLIRRSFVLLGQMPVRFRRPLLRRSTQTVVGIGIGIIPLAIAWSLVNLPSDTIKGASIFSSTQYVRMTVTPPPSPSITETPSSGTPNVIPTEVHFIVQAVPVAEESRVSSGWITYFLFCFPFFALFFGFVVWLPINLLMPIVHVELLLQGIDGVDDILEYLSS